MDQPMESDPIDELLKQLEQHQGTDEVDGGRVSFQSIIRRVGQVINIASKAISHLLSIIKPCLGKDLETRTIILEGISKNLVTLSELIINLAEQNERQAVQA